MVFNLNLRNLLKVRSWFGLVSRNVYVMELDSGAFRLCTTGSAFLVDRFSPLDSGKRISADVNSLIQFSTYMHISFFIFNHLPHCKSRLNLLCFMFTWPHGEAPKPFYPHGRLAFTSLHRTEATSAEHVRPPARHPEFCRVVSSPAAARKSCAAVEMWNAR